MDEINLDRGFEYIDSCTDIKDSIPNNKYILTYE